MRGILKKIGKELDELTDTLGTNHKLVRRTVKRMNNAKTYYKLEAERKSYSLCKEYMV